MNTPASKQDRPLVGVSRCLLGDAVRYDGKSKANKIVIENLSQLFEFIPVCPEVEAGLGVPRPAVQLTGNIDNPRLTGRNDAALDVTDIMTHYCQNRPLELEHLAGFIFKSKSPSCGLNSTPVFIDGRCVTQKSRGIFARQLCEKLPALAVIEDGDLENEAALAHFVQSILMAHRSPT